MVTTHVTKKFVLNMCELIYKQLAAPDFPVIAGKARLMRDIEDLIASIALHHVEPDSLGEMYDGLVYRFNDLEKKAGTETDC